MRMRMTDELDGAEGTAFYIKSVPQKDDDRPVRCVDYSDLSFVLQQTINQKQVVGLSCPNSRQNHQA